MENQSEAAAIDAYIAQFPEDVQQILTRIRKVVKKPRRRPPKKLVTRCRVSF